MSYEALLRQTATVIRAFTNVVDRYNNPVPGGFESATYRCYLEPKDSSERTVDENTQIATYTLFLPADADVRGGDRVEVLGDTFDVVGPPRPFYNPRLNGRLSHIVADLRRVDQEGGS